MAVIKCLKEEKDWLVLNLVLSEVPSVLQNKGMLTRSDIHIIFSLK
jgi:tuberous sclerosis protein 2